MTVERGERGFYWCPNHCTGPTVGSSYPERHWSTEKGILGHIAKCPLRSGAESMMMPTVMPKQREIYCLCPDCTTPIMEGETIWWMRDKIVCMDCHAEYLTAGVGHMEGAGIELGGDFKVA